ncbi:MAG TPA: hypothetical protein VK203_20405, partial [Nostocaceae cyanobacterium]|nr:hypothetical protein [Nostocaceae cyanobacterium]
GDGEMGRWGDGEMGRIFLSFFLRVRASPCLRVPFLLPPSATFYPEQPFIACKVLKLQIVTFYEC